MNFPLFSRPQPNPILPLPAALSLLKWEDVMSVSPVFDQTSENSKNELRRALANNVSSSLALGLQTAQITTSKGRMIVEFTDKAKKLKDVSLMIDKQGRKIPTLVRNGKAVANARVIGGGAALVNSAAAAVGAVVVASHMIAGADNAKRLKEANGKLDFLVFARKLDQCASMEAVFRQAKELSSLPDTPETRREIHRLGVTLHELRASWRGEVLHKLGEVDPKEPAATANWLAKPIRAMKSKSNGKKAVEEASQSLAELHLLNVSLGLHLALAQASGTTDAFLTQSLPEELEATRKLLEEVQHLKDRIPQRHRVVIRQFEEVEEAFCRTVETFEPLAMPAEEVRRIGRAA